MNSHIIPIRFDNFKVACRDMVNHPNFKEFYPCGNDNLSTWALRSLLILSGERNVLIDTGFGNKQSNSFFQEYHLHGGFDLDAQLSLHGIKRQDIDDVILTHLHFDHCGGCLLKEADAIVPAFPKATLWISKQQWDNAINPEDAERDSFLTENIKDLPANYKINFIEFPGEYLPGIHFKLASGHTKGQIIPVIRTTNRTILFGADLFPSKAHLTPEINMIYDMDPALATAEKSSVLREAFENNWIILFQHDLYNECCSLKQLNDKVVVDKVAKLSNFL